MPCPHGASPTTACQPKTTALGYQTFRCAACRPRFNERTGTPFNFLEYPQTSCYSSSCSASATN